jgi:hypothetical protein
MTEHEINSIAAAEIQNSRTYRGQRFDDGQWIALLDGEVVAVAESLDDILDRLREIEPNPERGMLVEAADPVVNVIRRI